MSRQQSSRLLCFLIAAAITFAAGALEVVKKPTRLSRVVSSNSRATQGSFHKGMDMGFAAHREGDNVTLFNVTQRGLNAQPNIRKLRKDDVEMEGERISMYEQEDVVDTDCHDAGCRRRHGGEIQREEDDVAIDDDILVRIFVEGDDGRDMIDKKEGACGEGESCQRRRASSSTSLTAPTSTATRAAATDTTTTRETSVLKFTIPSTSKATATTKHEEFPTTTMFSSSLPSTTSKGNSRPRAGLNAPTSLNGKIMPLNVSFQTPRSSPSTSTVSSSGGHQTGSSSTTKRGERPRGSLSRANARSGKVPMTSSVSSTTSITTSLENPTRFRSTVLTARPSQSPNTERPTSIGSEESSETRTHTTSPLGFPLLTNAVLSSTHPEARPTSAAASTTSTTSSRRPKSSVVVIAASAVAAAGAVVAIGGVMHASGTLPSIFSSTSSGALSGDVEAPDAFVDREAFSLVNLDLFV